MSQNLYRYCKAVQGAAARRLAQIKKVWYNAVMSKKRKTAPVPFREKYEKLRERQREFRASLAANRARVRALMKENTAKAKAEAKKLARKIAFGVKYTYALGGRLRNEIVGMLTVYNFGRAVFLHIKRRIRFDPNDEKLYLNIYYPLGKREGKYKVFLYIHGGGWMGGWPESREAFTTRIATAGYFVASIYYGEAPKYAHPRMIENIYTAIGYLREHADELNIDMDKIAIGGESAGAHLAAMAACISSNPEYAARFKLDERSKAQKFAAAVLNCGVYDLEKTVASGFRRAGIYTQAYCGGVPVKETDPQLRKEISPIYWVTSAFPPTFAISAENDKLALLTFDLIDKFIQSGVPYEHYHGEGRFAVHAFAVTMALKASRQAMKEIRKFLNKQFG